MLRHETTQRHASGAWSDRSQSKERYGVVEIKESDVTIIDHRGAHIVPNPWLNDPEKWRSQEIIEERVLEWLDRAAQHQQGRDNDTLLKILYVQHILVHWEA